jgi:uncharacterized repeat protein (TIGR01451 family)
MQNSEPSARQKALHSGLVVLQTLALLSGTIVTTLSPTTVAQADTNPGGAPATSQITGTVFQDFNSNGVMNTSGTAPDYAVDVGVPAVTVSAYAAGSATAVATAATTVSGTYTLTGLTAGTMYRVEFTNLPSGFEPAAQGTSGSTSIASNASSVQFAAAGTSNVSFAINRAEEYCQNNPQLCTNLHTFGDQINGGFSNIPVAYTWPITGNGSIFDATRNVAPTSVATGQQIGTTWGAAYQRSSRALFFGAYYKVYAGLGPGGAGAIYSTTLSGAPVVLATISNTGVVTHADSTPNTGDANNTPGSWLGDYVNWDRVGKSSLGAIRLAGDDQTLFVVNMGDRKLYSLNVNDSAPTPVDLGAIPNPCTVASDARPFGLGWYRGVLYVGGVCSAESTANTADLSAYVYTYSGGAFSATPVLTFPFNNTAYPHGRPGNGCNFGEGNWRPWTPINRFVNTSGTTCGYAQPMLTDIEFDKGNMILGIRDRSGDQTGENVPSIPGGGGEGVSAGDILRACGSPESGWTLESNGSCGGVSSGGVGNSDGPGGGEFYHDHFGSSSYSPVNHEEISVGGVMNVPGYEQVGYTAFDPNYINGNDWRSGGIRFDRNTTGAPAGFYSLYDKCDSSGINRADGTCSGETGRFGKSAAMGDLIALCDSAPIEIGNFVWNDLNNDGVQDPGEPGLPGVVVSLNTPAGIITTTTDANGQYLFKNEGANSPYSNTLRPFTAYTITIDPTQLVLQPYAITVANAQAVSGSTTSNDAVLDVRDSDATLTGGLATINYSTGAAGYNNHGLDFGFSQLPAQFGDRVWIESDTDGNANSGTLTPVAGMVITATNGANVYTTTTDASGYYSFSVPAGTYIVNYGPVPAAYGAVMQSGTPAGATTSGNAGSYAQSGNPDQARPNGTTVTVAAGQANWTVDFAFTPAPAQFGDRVWIETDTDGNANTGTLTPVAGMIITATDGNNVYTTTTDASGYYSFSVPAGTYTVNYGPVPAAYGPVVPSGTPAGATTSGNAGSYAQTGTPDQARPNGATVTVAAGQANWTMDFAFTPQLYDVGNKVWFDTNNDGIVGNNEQPVAGVAMELRNISGTVLATTQTDANGYYSFTNLPAGDYVIAVAGSNFATGGVLAAYRNSDGATAASNTATDNDRDHGNGPATAAAYVANGVASSVITLGPGMPTNEDGTAPATPNGDANANMTIDFGFYKLELGNRVWEDYNNNGIADAGEPALSNVSVELRDALGNVVSTTTTNSQGYYTFTNLVSGSYQVVLPASNFNSGSALAGLTSSTGANGNASGLFEPGIDEDNTLTGDDRDHGSVSGVLGAGGDVRSAVFALTPGSEPAGNNAVGLSQQPTLDFGLFRPASVGSLVWYDDDNDGQQDATEAGVPGVTVTLYLNGQPVSQTTTSANGVYTFSNLISGTNYSVQFDPPVGLTFTQQLNSGNADGIANDSDVPAGSTSGSSSPFELSYGEAEPDIDAGVFLPAGLGDAMWIDLNGNGLQDSGEQPIVGATVTLLKDNGSGVFEVYSTTQTVSNGYYWFDNLPADTYIVSFTLPSGYTWTQQTGALNDALNSDANINTGASVPVTLVRGERNPNIDAGVTPYASLGNYVWIDRNQDGLQNEAPANGLNDVTVNLLDANGNILRSTVTTNDINGHPGYYTFTQLVSATYQVEFVLPAGYTWTVTGPNSLQTGSSFDTDSNVINLPLGRTEPVVINWGDANPAIDAGVRPLVSLGDRVWTDPNNDGLDNDGPNTGIGNVLLELYRDSNGDGVFTSGVDTFVGTSTTDSNGYYTFDNLVEGDYVVVIPASNFETSGALAGMLSSDPTDLTDNRENQDDNGEVRGDVVAARAVNLTAGAETGDGDTDDTRNSSIDFGFWQPLSLGNQVWFDTNNNGAIDANEIGAEGVTVVLWNGTTPVMTTTTIAGGYYTFTNVPSGTFVVQIPASNFAPGAPLAGYRSSDPTVADPNTNVDDDDNGTENATLGVISGPVIMSPGDEPVGTDGDTDSNTNWTIDFGFYNLTLGNRVWLDLNVNGQQDVTENGIAGVPVTLRDINGVALVTTTTDANGYYTFTGLLSGTYSVEIEAPIGMISTVDTATSSDPNTDDDTDDNGVNINGRTIGSNPIVLIPGAEPIVNIPAAATANPSVDFGLQQLAGLGDFVWLDVNRDGIQNPGEPGVANVLVTLSTPTGTLSTSTDASGAYAFINLPPGMPYTVTFTAPNGFVWTTPGAGADRGADSNAEADGATAPVTLANGEFNATIDGGLWQPSVVNISKALLNPGPVRSGQSIGYQIVVENTGLTLARNVVIEDNIPVNTTYVNGSASPAATLANGRLSWPAIDLAPGAAYTVSFQAIVNANLTAITVITNVASVETSDQPVELASNPVLNPLNPTAVTLDGFAAELEGNNTRVTWRTSLERDTLGFNVWRSATGERAASVKVNATLIGAQGANGSTYTFMDQAFTGSYWIEEIELSGASNFYGPAVVATPALAPVVNSNVTQLAGPVKVDAPVMAGAVLMPGSQQQSIVSGAIVQTPSEIASDAAVITPVSQQTAMQQVMAAAVPGAAETAPQAPATNSAAVESNADGSALNSAPSLQAPETVTQRAAVQQADDHASKTMAQRTQLSNTLTLALTIGLLAGLMGLAGVTGVGAWLVLRRRR